MKRFPFIRAGLIFAVSPLVLAFVTSFFQGLSMWGEGGGTGTYIWFMMLTMPVGFVMVVIGLLRMIIGRWRSLR